MSARLRTVLLWCLAAITLFFLLAFWMMSKAMGFSEDFSTWQPTRVYTMVTGKSLPDGVSHIQASGRHLFIKEWVWLRIQGTPSALHALEDDVKVANSSQTLTVQEMRKDMSEWGSANPRYDEIDHARVGWDDWNYVMHPVDYEGYFNSSDGWTWHCFFVFDYSHNTVYVQAGGD